MDAFVVSTVLTPVDNFDHLQLADKSNPYNKSRVGVQTPGLLSLPILILNNDGEIIARFPPTSSYGQIIATIDAGEVAMKKGSKFTSETLRLRFSSTNMVVESGE